MPWPCMSVLLARQEQSNACVLTAGQEKRMGEYVYIQEMKDGKGADSRTMGQCLDVTSGIGPRSLLLKIKLTDVTHNRSSPKSDCMVNCSLVAALTKFTPPSGTDGVEQRAWNAGPARQLPLDIRSRCLYI